MTTIRLDTAILNQFRVGQGPVYLCDELGKPVFRCDVTPLAPLDEEPDYSPEQWQAIRDNPVKYKLDEVWERIRRGEPL